VKRPNLGLLLDAWHWARSQEPEKALRHIPTHYITGIQLSDDLARPTHDLTGESRHYRLIPGTGYIDLPVFLHALESHGVKAPLSVEVMSDRLDSLPPIQAASEVARGTRSVLWRAWRQSHHD
jgi:sugar phosphate isomerase/epimerase